MWSWNSFSTFIFLFYIKVSMLENWRLGKALTQSDLAVKVKQIISKQGGGRVVKKWQKSDQKITFFRESCGLQFLRSLFVYIPPRNKTLKWHKYCVKTFWKYVQESYTNDQTLLNNELHIHRCQTRLFSKVIIFKQSIVAH